MENIATNWPQLTAYYPSLVGLLILSIAILIQSFLAGVIGLAKGDEVPGKPLKGSHGDLPFRTLRTYGNSTENLPMFLSTLTVAIIVGVNAFWVNLLVGMHVAIRLAYWAIYYAGIGKVGGGPRTISYVGAFLANVLLAIMALIALF